MKDSEKLYWLTRSAQKEEKMKDTKEKNVLKNKDIYDLTKIDVHLTFKDGEISGWLVVYGDKLLFEFDGDDYVGCLEKIAKWLESEVEHESNTSDSKPLK